MRDAGATDIVIIIGGIGSNKVKEYYGDGEKFGVKITYVEQDYPKGIAHAIGLCKNFVGNEKFLVFLGDNIIQKSISDYAREFEKSDAMAAILLCEVDEPSRFGIADMKDGKITKIMEKPPNPPTNFAVTGIYFLTPKIFDIVNRLKPSWRNELEITDALQMLLAEGNKITYHVITDYWKDTGTPDDIIHANRAILDNMESYFHGKKGDDVSISGNIMIGKDTKINNTKIEGPVIIGNNCALDGVYVGPNTSVGDNTQLSYCNIGDSIIMSDCVLRGNLKIRKSIIAANSNITLENKNDEKVFLLGEGTRITL
jgi:glucose-1-phosphate thymidylyltransferase